MKSLVLVGLIAVLSALPTSFEEARSQSQKESMPLLLIFSGSDWCSACISFEKRVLSTEEFKSYTESDLVSFVADFPRNRDLISDAQLAENQELAELYNHKGAFPYLVLFSSTGEILKRKAGGFSSFDSLKKWVESANN